MCNALRALRRSAHGCRIMTQGLTLPMHCIMSKSASTTHDPTPSPPADASTPAPAPVQPPVEQGGRAGLDPVRYGDWEKNGRCIDF